MDEPRDRLMDMLLREQLGGETPPDLTDRILARAFPARGRSRLRTLLLAASISIAVGALTWIASSVVSEAPYPQPSATGSFEVVGGGPLQRGSVLRTQDKTAKLELGGYSSVELLPRTVVRIDGEKHAEAISIEGGEVRCAVERNVGSFTARTPMGTAAVLGTQFTVRVAEEKGAGDNPEKWVIVRVVSGLVELSGEWGAARLTAGTEENFRVLKGKTAEARGGKVIGVVTSRGEAFIEVRADGEEKPRRYMPNWVGGAGGGFDKGMLAAIGRTPVGNRVRLDWKFEERPRVTKLEVIAPAVDPK
jgi:ferric-dicitrate binding protein FerR (iron transport regulator)